MINNCIKTISGTTLILAGCQTSPTIIENKNEKPNIIIILADDLGWGDLSCYGSDSIYTPNIDKLSENGLTFTQFYTNGSVSTPTRAGLLTGRYQIRSGMTKIQAPWVREGLPPDEVTMAEMLNDNGYETGLIGKWHLGHQKGSLPNDQGFNYFFGLIFSNDMMIRESPAYKNTPEDQLLSLMRDTTIIDQPVYLPTLTQRYAAEAENFIAKNHNKPFFLYMAHWAPHEPLEASAEFKNSSKYGLYGDVVQEMDKSIGDVIAALERYGLKENTFIFFTSDNGARVSPQRFGNNEKCGSTGGLRGLKGNTFEGGIRVPGIAFWQGKIKPGIYKDPTIILDLFPTVAKMTNSNIPNDRIIDGIDISNILFDGGKRTSEELYFYRFDEPRSIVYGDYKYKKPYKAKKNYMEKYSHEEELLFNLEDDPYETTNLADSLPEITKMLREKLDSFDLSVKK
jgi:arylsulfatase A-like enzyme